MKKMIRAASADQDRAMECARKIYSKSKELFDVLEDTPSGFLDANDLGPLYEELLDVIPAIAFAIKSRTVEYQKDETGRIARR